MIVLWISLGILLAALIAGVVSLVLTYNKIVSLSARVDNSWANLVETVKGFAKQEEALLKEIVELRSNALLSRTAEESIHNNTELSGAVNRLMAISEAYPELKSSENFLSLQQELSDVEKKVAVARQFYNDTCMMYNEYIDKFPGVLLAQLLHYEHRSYFEAAGYEKEAPAVSL